MKPLDTTAAPVDQKTVRAADIESLYTLGGYPRTTGEVAHDVSWIIHHAIGEERAILLLNGLVTDGVAVIADCEAFDADLNPAPRYLLSPVSKWRSLKSAHRVVNRYRKTHLIVPITMPGDCHAGL